MKNSKYKLVTVGKGLQLYRVVRHRDGLNMDMTVSRGTGTPEKPWVVRWTDFMSTKHEAFFPTVSECRDFLERS